MYNPIPPMIPWQPETKIGLVKYNTFEFPPHAHATVQVEAVKDSSDRVIKWWKHTLTIETVITPQLGPQLDTTGTQPVDYNLEVLKRNLSVPGKLLSFDTRGFGFTGDYPNPNPKRNLFRVNASNDLDFGPVPQILIWEPIGANLAVLVKWTVTFCIPYCCLDGDCASPSFTPTNLQPTEFNYAIGFSVDDAGMTVRSITGTIEYPGLLIDDHPNTANFTDPLERLAPKKAWAVSVTTIKQKLAMLFPRILGPFKRDTHVDYNRDHRKFDFRITDTEIDSDTPLFNQVIECDIDVNLGSDLWEKGFSTWDLSISGLFKIIKGAPRYAGFLAFLTVVQSRVSRIGLDGAAVNILTDPNNGSTGYIGVPSKLLVGVHFTEKIMKREFSFEYNYMVVCHIGQILQATKMFQPVTTSTWSNWVLSLPAPLQDGTGFAGLGAGNTAEALLSVCTTDTPNNILGENPYQTSSYLYPGYIPNCQVAAANPDKTWLKGNIWFEWHWVDRSYIHQSARKMPDDYLNDMSVGSTISGSSYLNNFIPQSMNEQAAEGYSTGSFPASSNYPVIQSTSGRILMLFMRGWLLRLCLNPVVPSLISYGGVVPKQFGPIDVLGPKRIGDPSPLPIIGISFSVGYLLPRVPLGNPNLNVTLNGVPESFLVNQKVILPEPPSP